MSKYIRNGLLVLIAGLLLACSGDMTGNKEVGQASEYLSEGKLNAAVIELKNALQKNGNNQQARWMLGKLYFEKGVYADAIKELVKASELGQPDDDVLPLLAQSYLAMNDVKSLEGLSVEYLAGEAEATVLAAQGLSQLTRANLTEAGRMIGLAINTAPETPFVMVAQAKLKGVETGNWDSVRELLDRVIKLAPDYAPAWSLLGDIELQGLNSNAAEAAYTQALESDDSRLDDRYKRGLVRLQNENIAGAKEDASVLLKRAPQSPGGQYLQGILLFQDGNMKDAVTAFDVAQMDENRYPMSLFYLAAAHNTLGNIAQAEDSAYRYLAIAPNSAPGRKLLATIKLQEGNYAEAEELIRPVVEGRGEDVQALNILAGVLLKQGDNKEGLEILAKVVALQPESPEAQSRLGAGLLATGDAAASLEHIETALKLDPEFEQADLLLVSAYLRQGDIPAALKAIDSYETKNPDSVVPHNLRGEIYLSQEKVAEAKQAFNKALAIAKNDVIANNKLAFLSIQEENFGDARAYYEAILVAQPDHLETLLKLAALSELQKDYEGMEVQLKKAVETHPKDVQPRVMLARFYLTRGQPEQVAVILSPLDQSAQNLPDVLNVMGMSFLEREEYQDALATFERLIIQRPDAPQPHYHLGMTYRGLGDTDKEQAEFEKAVEMSPAYSEPRIELTRILFRQNDKKRVEENLAILNKLAPEHPEVLQLGAVKAMRDGDAKKALALSEQAFEKAPTTRNMLVLAQQRWVMGDQDGSREVIQSWLKKNPEDILAHHELATLYMSAGEEKKAIEEYSAILDIAPKNVVALNNLAWLLQDSNPKKALGYAEKAVDISGQAASALDTLAVILLKNGEIVRAQRAIERAVSQSKGDASILYHSAMINSAAGDDEAAINTLKSLLADSKSFAYRAEAEQLLKVLTSKN